MPSMTLRADSEVASTTTTKPSPRASATPSPTPDATGTVAALRAEGTREALAFGRAAAAVTPGTLGPWRSAEGQREAWIEVWPCPTEGAPEIETSASGGAHPAVPRSYERLLARVADEPPTLIDSQLILCGGLGAYGLDGRWWSPDGAVFYYTRDREGGPDGQICGEWQPGLRAWDSRAGTTIGGFTVSSGRDRVARIVALDEGGFAVEVHDVDLTSATTYPLPDAVRPDDLVWSPDGTGLAVPDWPRGCGHALAAVYAVRPGDGSVLRQTLPDPAAEVTDVGWDADSQSIRLATGSEDAWRWDLVANRVTRATP
ncbi:MAG: PD40 domain-containing protein [Caldilineae bacterium]|nr:PD40 domain-containing protein [Chloroflexota bacterium]MCB9176550.1 PD40 domain-containing protein [Caldilineae bacterium]